jgi:hypothetical protein
MSQQREINPKLIVQAPVEAHDPSDKNCIRFKWLQNVMVDLDGQQYPIPSRLVMDGSATASDGSHPQVLQFNMDFVHTLRLPDGMTPRTLVKRADQTQSWFERIQNAEYERVLENRLGASKLRDKLLAYIKAEVIEVVDDPSQFLLGDDVVDPLEAAMVEEKRNAAEEALAARVKGK